MKIKEICLLTGLTDKSVRFYIDNKLIVPHYTENHLGRRSFTFSEENIRELDDIATLRKAGFSVAQIREIQQEKEKSIEIIAGIIAFKENQIEENKIINAALSQLESDKAYTVREIADILREPARGVVQLQEEEDWIYRLLKWAKLLIAAYMCIAPVVVYLIGFFICFSDSGLGYGFLITPTDWPTAVLAWIAMLVPSIIFALSFIVKKARKITRLSTIHNAVVFSVLFVLSLTLFNFYLALLCTAGTDYKMETYSVKDYYSTYVYAQDNFLPDNIPSSVMKQAENCEHRYNCSCDFPVRYYFSTYGTSFEGSSGQLYAEWTLSQEELKNELARIEGYFGKGTDYIHGDFIVKVFEYNNEYGVKNCCIFSYNENTGNVRYIYCGGFVATEYYFMTVPW